MDVYELVEDCTDGALVIDFVYSKCDAVDGIFRKLD